MAIHSSVSRKTSMSHLALLVTVLSFVTSSTSLRHEFKHDVDVGEAESGERLQLHSQGHLGDIIDLDSVPQVKRVLCTGNRLVLAMTDSTVAHGWREGQVILAGPKWGCQANQTNSSGAQIYVRVSQIVFTVEGRRDVSNVDLVTIYHVPAGPFDMLQEANIFFRYEAGKQRHHRHHEQLNNPRARFRRSVSNMVSNVLDNIDWQANFTTVLPLLDTGDDAVALHKTWGQKGLSMTPGANAASITDDFTLLLGKLTGENRISYTFDLVIKNVEGTPKVVRYISQFDVNSDLQADASVKFNREMGVSYNTTVRESPIQELLRVPVVTTLGMPHVFLVVTSQSLVQASVHAYSSGAAVLETGYTGSGFVTLSHQYDPVQNTGSDATTRDWSIQPGEQSLASRHKTEIDVSLFQKLMFKSAISWHYHDIDLELSPPAEMTLRQLVSVRSRDQGVARCVDSNLKVDTDMFTAASQFTATAFGLDLWDVPLQPAMSKHLEVTEASLGQFCEAKCDGPSYVTFDLNSGKSVETFGRTDQMFASLTKLDGNQIQFVDPGDNAQWCGAPGMPCYSCNAHAYDTPTSQTCATRLMTSRLASALSHLAELVATEWPQKQLLILEAWDEPTSERPSGAHGADSLYKTGRAATLGLTQKSSAQSSLGQWSMERLGQLAVCAGLEHVNLDTRNSRLEVAVRENGAEEVEKREGFSEDDRNQFWSVLRNMDVEGLYPHCVSAPYMTQGSTWPDFTRMAETVVGPAEKQLRRSSRKDMANLVQFTLDGDFLTFDPEGQGDAWCGAFSRQCILDCTSSSGSEEPWDWCSTRMMTPRLAIRLRTLQKLAEKDGIDFVVKQAFKEITEEDVSSPTIFNEGRALVLSTLPAGNESGLASLAVCAGFDFVEFSREGHVTVYVITQHGYRAQSVEFLEGSSHIVVSSENLEVEEYAIPTEDLKEEADLPRLVDGGFQPNVYLSEHVTTGDVTSRDDRYFRLDQLLLLCVELVLDDFPSKVEIVKGSAYRTRSHNFLHNLDARHVEEQWRHQTGQAIRLRPLPTTNSSLLLLAKSVLRVCPTLTQSRLKGVGLGCHGDSVYVDVRPLDEGGDLGYVKVWDDDTAYCNDVIRLQANLLTGGPVIQSDNSVTCKSRGLDEGLQFLAFQMGQSDLCQVPKQAEFCATSLSAREAAADRLQEVLTASAGHGRLPRFDIITDIRACLVENCGGCMGSGPKFDQKVRDCARVVHKYLERAAAPYPDLKDATTFFNTDTDETTVHGEACKTGKVCVEETIIYSLLLPTVTARFYPDPSSSVEREMFEASINPTPLLDIAAQELAARASGLVTVFIQSERDTYALRNVLKVLLAFNKNVSLVEFQVAPGVDIDLVTSSIQRKITSWAGVICPEHSRFAIAPFVVSEMDPIRHKRSAELSQRRNEARSTIYNWESEWLKKML